MQYIVPGRLGEFYYDDNAPAPLTITVMENEDGDERSGLFDEKGVPLVRRSPRERIGFWPKGD